MMDISYATLVSKAVSAEFENYCIGPVCLQSWRSTFQNMMFVSLTDRASRQGTSLTTRARSLPLEQG